MRTRLRSGSLVGLLFLVALPVALAAQETLCAGQTRSGSLSTGDTLLYTFEAGEDFLLYGEVDQISVDVVVSPLSAEGRQLGRWDGPGRGAEAFSSSIRDAGSHTRSRSCPSKTRRATSRSRSTSSRPSPTTPRS